MSEQNTDDPSSTAGTGDEQPSPPPTPPAAPPSAPPPDPHESHDPRPAPPAPPDPRPAPPAAPVPPQQPAAPQPPSPPPAPQQPAPPAEPAAPQQPAPPAEPAAPQQPTYPTAPQQPVPPPEPAAPQQHQSYPPGPQQPTQPAYPTAPQQPAPPAAPQQPTYPTAPQQPVRPAEPGAPQLPPTQPTPAYQAPPGSAPLPGIPMPGSPAVGTPVPGMALPPGSYGYGHQVQVKKGPKPLLIIGVATLALIIGVVGWITLTGDDPELTYNGDSIEEPETTLTRAEATLDDIVETRHGATSDDTRCYFAIPNNAERDSDVSERLRCGPVLFVDGDAERAYVSFPLEAQEAEGGGIQLVAGEQPEADEPEALPSDETMRRPDGQGPPSGAGDLEVPEPPRADAGLLEAHPLDGVELDTPEGNGRIGSWSTTLDLTGFGQPERVGRGDDARRPAEGEIFVAAQFEASLGEGLAATGAEALIQVGDDEPVPAPGDLAFGGGGVLISAPEDVERVDLILRDRDTEQRLALLTGQLGSNNIEVLQRENRSQPLNSNGNMTVTASAPGFVTETFSVGIHVTDASLHYWGGDTERTPSGPANAWMVMEMDVDWPPTFDLGALTIFNEPVYHLITPGGRSIGVTNLASDTVNRIIVGFDVPAEITDATFRISGSYTDGSGVLVTLGSTFDVPISIPAG